MNKKISKAAAKSELKKVEARKIQLLEIINSNEADITKRITSVKDAFKAEGRNYDTWLKYQKQAGVSPQAIAFEEIAIFCKVLNEGWDPDYRNSSEYKYYPYFNMSSGFSFHYVLSTGTLSGTAARHVLKTDALARFAGNTILETYKTFNTF